MFGQTHKSREWRRPATAVGAYLVGGSGDSGDSEGSGGSGEDWRVVGGVGRGGGERWAGWGGTSVLLYDNLCVPFLPFFFPLQLCQLEPDL